MNECKESKGESVANEPQTKLKVSKQTTNTSTELQQHKPLRLG